ncbi:50S ribosomal protein L10 [Candidatus Woesearchaeota archaeon]|nr:50S ribosomal protein L10 [Candidatus Woesearchaeota archaeon]
MVEEKKTGEEASQEKPAPEAEVHVSKYKKKVVKDLVKLMKEYPIIGAINMENMPAGALAKMRQQLRDQVVIYMAKRRVMKYAFDEVEAEKKGIKDLIPHLKGMPALLFTKENPFSLFKVIKKNKSSAPAKPGQEAPKDIVVKAGPTPFVPGPVIGELGSIGIKTEVVEGKIHIKEDSLVVKEGEEINAAAAGLLQRLGIEPMEVGLDLVAVYEDGVIYDKKVLDIDEEAFLQSLSDAGRWAFNLAIEAGYYTKETVGVLVPKAFREAKSIALEAGIMTDAVAEELVAKAEAQASALKAKIPEAPKEEAKPEEKKEEPKVEEKAEEAKPEPEAPKEEPKPEAPKEEPKVEEKPVEEAPKVEVKPVEEPKVEEKIEEAPKEEVKEEPKPEPELPDTSKVITEAIKMNEEAKAVAEKPETAVEEKKDIPVAEKKPEVVSATPEEKVEKQEEEIVEELIEIKEEVKEEKKDPSTKDVEKIEKEVEKVEEKLEKVEEEKAKIPPVERIIIEKKPEPKPVGREIDPEKQKAAQEGEALFEQLKKKGTLRGIEKEKELVKPAEPKSPQEIIDDAHKKMDEKKDEVPSAHDLLKKKLRKK